MLTIKITDNFDQVARAYDQDRKQAQFAAINALNRSMQFAETKGRQEMHRAFDRPTPFFLRSLRVIYAKRGGPVQAGLWFKDSNRDTGGEAMVVPHIEGGTRRRKPLEYRLRRAGLIPPGWFAVPGTGADLDANGNMSRGQISQLLNVLGTFTEAGYNKANQATRDRLRKGSTRKGKYGFEYFVNPVGGKRASHLLPGVWKRIYTGFGSAVKPILIFVSGVTYRKRFDFYGVAHKEVEARFPAEFDAAFEHAMRTAR
jgi:hypothetical protein